MKYIINYKDLLWLLSKDGYSIDLFSIGKNTDIYLHDKFPNENRIIMTISCMMKLEKAVEVLKGFGFNIEYLPNPKLNEVAKRYLKVYSDKGYSKIVKKENGIFVLCNRGIHVLDTFDIKESEIIEFDNIFKFDDLNGLTLNIPYDLEAITE